MNILSGFNDLAYANECLNKGELYNNSAFVGTRDFDELQAINTILCVMLFVAAPSGASALHVWLCAVRVQAARAVGIPLPL